MADIDLKTNLIVAGGKFRADFSLVEFIEDGITIFYSPALDLSGYGKTEKEAKASFWEVMNEFFSYTCQKKTLYEVLISLGWTIKNTKKQLKFTPPKDADLVATNALYNEIVNNKSYKVSRENIEITHKIS